jgi:hypothetical protein
MPSVGRIRVIEPQIQPFRDKRVNRHAFEILAGVVAQQQIHLIRCGTGQRCRQDLRLAQQPLHQKSHRGRGNMPAGVEQVDTSKRLLDPLRNFDVGDRV